MIRIDGLIKSYGMNPVLRGINLHVPEGGSLALVGANGAGKTTLLRIVATLLKADGGEVKVGGWPLPDHADRVRRYLGLVSHQPLLYADLSAAENLRFFARLYNLPDAEERIVRSLKLVGLAARQRDPVRSFSRGMIQRLAIARATLHEPDVLLLDEPYTGLDQDGVALLDDLLRREMDNGRTILMISHNLNHARALCQRIAILTRGKIGREVNSDDISDPELAALYAEQTGHAVRSKD